MSYYLIASFGVGELIVHNETHAYYAWHRHACGSDDASAYYMNFSDSCVTPQDTSPQNMSTSDITWLIKPAIEDCPNRWISTLSTTTITDDDDDNNNNENDLSDTEIALIVLCTLFGTLNVILFGIIVKLIYYPTTTTILSSSSNSNHVSVYHKVVHDKIEADSTHDTYNLMQSKADQS